jgi:hypothetical protein
MLSVNIRGVSFYYAECRYLECRGTILGAWEGIHKLSYDKT